MPLINDLKCTSLFTNKGSIFDSIIRNFTYPWEALSKIDIIIEEILSEYRSEYTRLKDGVYVGKNVKISDSARIDGPAIIGHNCTIRHGAYIRGNVILGECCTVGNSSEVKNSIFSDRAQAPHFNYVGDSILGSHAHLGAGAICSNLRSDQKPVTIKTAYEVIETGRRKLGAILGDSVEIGCGAVLCPGTVVGKNTTVYPLTTLRGYYPDGCIVKSTRTVIKKI